MTTMGQLCFAASFALAVPRGGQGDGGVAGLVVGGFSSTIGVAIARLPPGHALLQGLVGRGADKGDGPDRMDQFHKTSLFGQPDGLRQPRREPLAHFVDHVTSHDEFNGRTTVVRRHLNRVTRRAVGAEDVRPGLLPTGLVAFAADIITE